MENPSVTNSNIQRITIDDVMRILEVGKILGEYLSEEQKVRIIINFRGVKDKKLISEFPEIDSDK